MKGEAWTKEEEAILLRGRAAGRTCVHLAGLLPGRSVAAIFGKCRHLGEIASRQRRPKPPAPPRGFTKAQIAFAAAHSRTDPEARMIAVMALDPAAMRKVPVSDMEGLNQWT